MRIFSWARTPSLWLRAALLAVVLGFGLNTIAHITHAHDATVTSAHHLSCGYCHSFGTLHDAPRHVHALAPQTAHAHVVPTADRAPPSRVRAHAAQPRAPPLS